MMRIQNQFDLPLIGDDESLDQRLEKMINDFFDWNMEKNDLYEKGDDYLSWLLHDPSSNSDREVYFRISYWLESCARNTEEGEKISSSYKSIYNKDLKEIDESEIWKAYAEFRKKWRRELRSLRKSKVRLIDFSPQDLMAFLPLLSILFIIAGYFHTSLLYGHFNVDASQFFSMSDYLAGSIEQIRHALFSLIGLVLGFLHGFRIAPTITKYEHQRYANWRREMYFFVPGAIYLFFAYIPIFPSFQMSITPQSTMIAIILASQTPILFISARYFKNGRFVYSFCMAMAIFFASLYTSTLSEIDEIENGRPKMTFEIRSGGKKYTEQDSIFVGSNSRYIFLYRKDKNTRIIPLTQIEYISLETRS